ncbi:MAG TPA: LamG-like jellyroll fold domain-containing protein [Thermoanaerobaculia bacterium]|nr:LamG-like jellyroll fold domain-containing protein [Thermoanaerobaculia bacterium]
MTSNRLLQSALVAAGALIGLAIWLILREGAVRGPWNAAASPDGSVEVRSSPSPGGLAPGRGFVVWESNRSGRWRLWIQDLRGSEPRQLTPEDGARIHCCPHISPDGAWIAWLSLDPGPDRYPEKRAESGALKLIRPDGTGLRDLVPRARAYGEHRAAVWHGRQDLVFIDAEGYTARLSVDSGERERLVRRPHPMSGWLIGPGLSHAVDGLPTFSFYDPRRREVTELQAFGGCQPYFSRDGRWGYWVAGAGGPLYKIELKGRAVSTLLGKSDPRLPGAQGYLYFPMLSSDQSLLAFGASAGGHDHWTADYDIHLVDVDPSALEIAGIPVRVAPHPGVDRFPDVFVEPGRKIERIAPAEAPQLLDESDGWPSSREGLAFLWETADAPNVAADPAKGVERSFPVEREGAARLDHFYRMDLGGGVFVASEEAGQAVAAAVRRTNEVTVEAVVTPRLGRQRAAILALSGGRQDARDLVLAQEGDELVLHLAVARRGRAEHAIRLGQAAPGRATHVLVSYRPGHLAAWRDGQEVLTTEDLQGDFFRWRPRPLTFGAERRQPGFWSGWLEGVAIYGRALGAEEASENVRLYREKAVSRSPVPQERIRARLVARSRIPILQEISPYREALAVYEYQAGGKTIRVAHWVILDGERQPAAGWPEGEVRGLLLEPFAANPQLESVFLSDTLPPAPGVILQYEAGR